MPACKSSRPTDGREVLADCLGESELEGIANQGVADGYLIEKRNGGEKRRQVVKVEIVPGVDAEAKGVRSLGRLGVARQFPMRFAVDEGVGVRLGVQLDAVSTNLRCQFDLFGDGVHEQADAAAEVVQGIDDGT